MIRDLPLHGGNLAVAAARWGTPANGWLDLSTGVNPWSYPLPDLPEAVWRCLPGDDLDLILRQEAARRFAIADPSLVLAGPGTSALIQALPRVRPAGTVAIVGPTYGEHARAWSAAGHNVITVDRVEQADADVVLVVSPNNPDGRILSRDGLARLRERQRSRRGLVVIDEAFCDEYPRSSLAPDLGRDMVILRSFGKFYGLAGLRLGFALAPPEILTGLAAQLGPWPVSGPALVIGAAALADEAWAEATRERLAGAAADLDRVLLAGGMTILGGTSLFRLAHHGDAPGIYDRLGRQGILVRAFTHDPKILRFGLPNDRDGLGRLAAALS